MKKYCFKGCFCSKSAFTLLELLVVVLIIGILTAIAVPQYQVAVEKARFSEALVLGKKVKDAQERYYLGNGTYTNKAADLDIVFPSYSGHIITLPSGVKIFINNSAYVYVENSKRTNTLVLNYAHHTSSPNLRRCYAKQGNTTANRVCKSLGGIYRRDADDCTIGPCSVYNL